MKSKSNPIEKLLQQCKKGNARAQMELYRQFSKAMYNTAFRILENADDAEDAMQEGFITAFDKIDEVRDVERFPGWIKTIVVRKALTLLEQKKKIIPIASEMKAIEFQPHESHPSKEGNKALIWQNIQELKPNYKTVLVLMYYEGMDYEEISDIMGLNYGNCRTLVSRAKEQLKKNIKNTAHVS